MVHVRRQSGSGMVKGILQGRGSRLRGGVIAFAVLALLCGATPASPAPAAASAVTTVAIPVASLERSLDFYTRVLTFQKVDETEVVGEDYERAFGVFGLRIRAARLRLGTEDIELREFLAPRGRPYPAESRSNDRWFQHVAIVVRDMGAAYRRLRQNDVEHASSGPQRLPDWNPGAGGIQAFYFKDPDGHPLEIIQFPAGKGDPRWQRPGEELFLGIDHTAIVTAATDVSLRFYRDLLGLNVVGAGENYGTEQEHLNNVFGARLRITTLRAPAGPGVELLEYLAPRDGRPAPLDQRANHLASIGTRLQVTDVGAAADAAVAAGYAWVSPGAVSLDDAALGFRKTVALRDPDGHLVRLIERP